MPKIAKEVPSGTQFSRSSNEGQVADSQTRAFRIVKNAIDEIVDIQDACDVRIGDQHPYNTNLYCVSFDARFDGDSRMVIAVTFNYQASPSVSASGSSNQDPKSQPPDVRPADWTTSASLIEVPVYTWFLLDPASGDAQGIAKVPMNEAGDRFDAIAKYEPIITISVQHWETSDPTKNCEIVGTVNELPMQIGQLNCAKHTLMLRGISSQPAIESWGGLTYRGWNTTYEFAYRRNSVKGLWNGDGNATVEADIGWDIAVPETGFNVRAFVPAGALPEEDIFGQPLKHKDGKIAQDPVEQLPDNVAVGDKMRAMVKVFEYENGGVSQAPSAQPIPLNIGGTPRKSFGNDAADPPIIIRRYLIYKEHNFRQMGLRGLGN